MSTPFTEVTNTNLWEKDVWNEIKRGIHERNFTEGPFNPFRRGDEAYRSASSFQSQIEGLAFRFSDPEPINALLQRTDLEVSDTFPTGGMGVERMFQLALGSSGWRRKAEIEDDFSYGRTRRGDIVGPWIIEDMQRTLQVLAYQSTRATQIGDQAQAKGSRVSGFDNIFNEQDAKALAEARYAQSEGGVDPSNPVIAISSWNGPLAPGAGIDTGKFIANLSASRRVYQFPYLNRTAPANYRAYIAAFGGPEFNTVFDAHGRGFANRTYTLISDGVAPAYMSTQLVLPAVGNLTRPEWREVGATYGFFCGAPQVLLTFNFTNA